MALDHSRIQRTRKGLISNSYLGAIPLIFVVAAVILVAAFGLAPADAIDPPIPLPPPPTILPFPPTIVPAPPIPTALPTMQAVRAQPAVPIAVAARPSQTISFTACNRVEEPIYVAVAYPRSDQEVTMGWWTIQPNECKTLDPFPLQHKRFSFFAKSASGRQWSGTTWYCVSTGSSFTLSGALRAQFGTCPDGYELRAFQTVMPATISPGQQNMAQLSYQYQFSE